MLFCVQVFDIVIHRYLELPPVTKSLETLLDHLGCLYKFHGTVLNVFNYYYYYCIEVCNNIFFDIDIKNTIVIISIF